MYITNLSMLLSQVYNCEVGAFQASWLLPISWILISLGLTAFELFTPGTFFFLAFGVGCACAAIAAFSGYSIVMQCLVSALASIIFFIILKKLIKVNHLSQLQTGVAHTNISALIGAHAIVTKNIGSREPGQIKVGRELWPAREKDGIAVEADSSVLVIGISGNTLIVKELS